MNTMRAISLGEYGGPEVLQVSDVELPEAPPGAVRVRVRAASVNPLDYKIRSGSLREVLPLDLPVVPGRDAAGVVDQVGDGVDDVAVGDRVFGLGTAVDAYAEHAVLHAWAPTPDAWSDVEAAAAALTSVTAIRGLRELGDVDGPLVVLGAGGGVGSAAVTIAVARGLRVLGVARTQDHDFLRSIGVEPVTAGADAVEAVRAAAGADPFVLDTAGGPVLEEWATSAVRPERIVTVVDPGQAEQLGTGYADGQNDAPALRETARLAATGGYRPRVGLVLPLEEAVQAHRAAEERSHRGKIVLEVG